MSKHKKQHYIPKFYLEAWCDSKTPEGQNPYVWQFNKDGKGVRNKAPKNIFHETDLYTIKKIDGQRDLLLENGLQSLEDRFCRIRNATLSKKKSLSFFDRIIVIAFMAAMQGRTIANRDHQKRQWKKLVDLGEKIKKSFDEALPEQKEAMKSIPFSNDEKHSISFEEAKDVAEHPLQNLLFPQIFATIPLLIKLDFCVLEADSQTGFITSDNPCVWYDPEGYKRHPHYRAPALMYPSIEITMPISPKQLILLNRKSINGNIKIDENKVDEFNRRTRFNCYHYFVVNSKIKKSHWFWKGVEPNDSWEKLNKSEKQT